MHGDGEDEYLVPELPDLHVDVDSEWQERWGSVLKQGEIEYSQWLESPNDTNLFFITRAWNDAFGHFCWNHPHYALMGLHVLIGQLPNMREVKIIRPSSGHIDPRVHGFYMAESASGKGRGSDFVAKVAGRLGIVYKSVGVVTTNALIGAHDPNRGHRIEPGYLNQDAFRAIDKEPIQVLELSEAKMIMSERPRPEQEDIMDNLQKTMNVYATQDNVVSKKIGLGEEIAFHTNVSLFMTTYPPRNLGDIIMDRGFIQRCLTSIRETNPQQREIDAQIRLMDRSDQDAYVRNYCLPIIEKFLRQTNEHAAFIKEVRVHPKAARVLTVAESKLYDAISKTRPHLWSILGTFITRFGDIQLKIASHFAIMRGKSVIDEVDADFATSYIQDNFRQVISWLEDNLRANPNFEFHYNERMKMLERSYAALTAPGMMFDRANNPNGWVVATSMMGWLVSQMSCSEESAKKYVDEFIRYGELETKTHNIHGLCVRLRPDGRKWEYGVDMRKTKPRKES